MTAPQFHARHLVVAGRRIAVTYAAGPWIEGVDPTTIKVRPRGRATFGAEVRAALAVENNSDSREDYFEADCIRVTSAHPLYAAVRAAAVEAV
jgi:hypothetical protein